MLASPAITFSVMAPRWAPAPAHHIKARQSLRAPLTPTPSPPTTRPAIPRPSPRAYPSPHLPRLRSRSAHREMAPCLRAILNSTLLPAPATAAAVSPLSVSWPTARPSRNAPTRPLALLRGVPKVFLGERTSLAPPRQIRSCKKQALQLRSYPCGDTHFF